MVEKNSGVPPIVAEPLQQSDKVESVVTDVEVTPQTKRSRKSKVKQDIETDPVPNPDPVNAEQPTTTAAAAATAAAAESQGPVTPSEKVENTVEITDHKRKTKRSRPLPPIEHKRIVHYYRQARPYRGKDRRSGDKDRLDGGSSRDRYDRIEKTPRHDYVDDDDDDDDDELLSDSDWDVDSGDDSDPSDDDSEDGKRVTGSKHKPAKDTRRDDGGRFAPVHAVMQYRIV